MFAKNGKYATAQITIDGKWKLSMFVKPFDRDLAVLVYAGNIHRWWFWIQLVTVKLSLISLTEISKGLGLEAYLKPLFIQACIYWLLFYVFIFYILCSGQKWCNYKCWTSVRRQNRPRSMPQLELSLMKRTQDTRRTISYFLPMNHAPCPFTPYSNSCTFMFRTKHSRNKLKESVKYNLNCIKNFE